MYLHIYISIHIYIYLYKYICIYYGNTNTDCSVQWSHVVVTYLRVCEHAYIQVYTILIDGHSDCERREESSFVETYASFMQIISLFYRHTDNQSVVQTNRHTDIFCAERTSGPERKSAHMPHPVSLFRSRTYMHAYQFTSLKFVKSRGQRESVRIHISPFYTHRIMHTNTHVPVTLQIVRWAEKWGCQQILHTHKLSWTKTHVLLKSDFLRYCCFAERYDFFMEMWVSSIEIQGSFAYLWLLTFRDTAAEYRGVVSVCVFISITWFIHTCNVTH